MITNNRLTGIRSARTINVKQIMTLKVHSQRNSGIRIIDCRFYILDNGAELLPVNIVTSLTILKEANNLIAIEIHLTKVIWTKNL